MRFTAMGCPSRRRSTTRRDFAARDAVRRRGGCRAGSSGARRHSRQDHHDGRAVHGARHGGAGPATRRRLQLGKGDAIRAMTRVSLTAAMRGTRAFRATGTSPRDSIGRESSGVEKAVEKAENRQKAERPGKNIPSKAAWESPVSYRSLTEKANTGRKIFTFPAISEMVS